MFGKNGLLGACAERHVGTRRSHEIESVSVTVGRLVEACHQKAKLVLSVSQDVHVDLFQNALECPNLVELAASSSWVKSIRSIRSVVL